MRVRENLEMEKLEESLVVCDTESGEAYLLNPTASFVVQRLQEEPSDIINEYIRYFEVSEEVANEDVRNIFTKLIQCNLVK